MAAWLGVMVDTLYKLYIYASLCLSNRSSLTCLRTAKIQRAHELESLLCEQAALTALLLAASQDSEIA